MAGVLVVPGASGRWWWWWVGNSRGIVVAGPHLGAVTGTAGSL